MSIAPVEKDMLEVEDEAMRPEFPQETRMIDDDDDPTPVRKKGKRRSTTHLKAVPETLELREKVKAAAEEYARNLDRCRAFTRNELEHHGRALLDQMGLPEKFLGFSMVMVGNFFWKQQFLAIPFNRRMLLLPHCLKHAEGCPAEYTQFGLDCERCGACSIADYKVRAEQLGVACLNVLEKAIDKVLIAGVPSYAVPLHSGDCLNTTLDDIWVWDVLDKYEPMPEKPTTSYVPLMRASAKMFESDFDRLLPRIRTKDEARRESPVAFTENIAYDWLSKGGKRFRPFITLAAWQSASGKDSLNIGDETPEVPDAVARVAMAIEAFHKASLVHDDIQDDDQYRYGRETLHRQHGASHAINIGDYLIGLGYRLIHAARDLSPEIAIDVLNSMSTAHVRLCDGQGAEMAFQKSPDWNLTPLDALQIYALKTSPAFEAALYAGLRMANHPLAQTDLVPQFCRHVGVAFQVLNDLKDWTGDTDNKLVAGQDALALRPTVLLALALKDADARQKSDLKEILAQTSDGSSNHRRIDRLREIFRECDVFEKAEFFVERSREKAEALVADVEDEKIRDLLQFFIETVLARELPPTPLEEMGTVVVPLGSRSLSPALPMVSAPVELRIPELSAR